MELSLQMREVKDDKDECTGFEVLDTDDGQWKKIPFVVGAYIRETMPTDGYTMIDWKIIQVYSYALAHYAIDEENCKKFLGAMEEMFPDTIEKYVKDVGWKKDSS